MNLLKNHPFPVVAFFRLSQVFTFALPKNQLQPFIPDCFSLDTYKDEWAFLAIAMVQTTQLRPKGFPRFMGQSFFLIGYRIFVRYTNKAGKRLRGLYILRSETDSKRMVLLGNLFTHYNYNRTDIQSTEDHTQFSISSRRSGFELSCLKQKSPVALPITSPFQNWQEARRFAGPLPHTFTFLPKTNAVLIVKGIRRNWQPKPIELNNYSFDFLEEHGLQNAVLANAFSINNIPYQWEKGVIEKW